MDAIGLAMFGPIDIDPESPTYGYVTTTPKKLWRNADVRGYFTDMGVPIGFHTDVQAAAMGELKHGGHGKISSCTYTTVGTGVGIGVVVNGQHVGAVTHTEGGHIRVARHPKDTEYSGNCPYHGDCLEGLLNAKALADRLGVSPSKLKTVSDDHEVWDMAAEYLAQMCVSLTLLLSPNVIVLGGGVLNQPCLMAKTRKRFVALIAGYLQIPRLIEEVDTYIVRSRFDVDGNDLTSAGTVGALELAQIARNRTY